MEQVSGFEFSALIFRAKKAAREWLRRNARLRFCVLRLACFYLRALVFFRGGGQWRIWARNSLALGYNSGLSDLDITLFSPTQSVVPEKLLRVARRWCWLGEWAIYVQDDRRWVSLVNGFELERDPILYEKFGSPLPQPGDGMSYWIRLYESDAFLRTPLFKLREGKWRFHLSQLRRFHDLPPESNFPDFLDETARALSGGRLSLERVLTLSEEEEQAVLRPHRWYWRAHGAGIDTEEVLARLWRREEWAPYRDLSRAQIRWEAWGLLGQVRLNKNYLEVIRHLEGLTGMLPRAEPLRAEMNEFLAYLRSFPQ